MITKEDIKWQKGTPDKLGYYFVLLSDGRIEIDEFFCAEGWSRDEAFFFNFYATVVSWCIVDDENPYNEECFRWLEEIHRTDKEVRGTNKEVSEKEIKDYGNKR